MTAISPRLSPGAVLLAERAVDAFPSQPAAPTALPKGEPGLTKNTEIPRPAEGSGPYEMSADDGNTVMPVRLAAFLKSKKTPLRCEPEESILLTDG